MGLFGNKENKEEKQEEVREKLIENYKFDGMSEKDKELLTKIVIDLQGNEFFKNGVAHFANIDDSMKISYLSAIMQQNFIMINQLAKLNSNIEKLLEK
jgi:hypothetical protein